MNKFNLILLAFVCGAISYSLLLEFVVNPTQSCIKSFTRATLENPSWAKAYWEEVVSEYQEQKR